MRHLFWAILLGSWLMFAVVSVSAQADSGWADNVVRQLLAKPVEYGRGKGPNEPKVRTGEFFSDQNVPPDDASLEDLLEYWLIKGASYNSVRPSATVHQRLMAACVEEPKHLPHLLKILEDKTDAQQVKKIWDTAANNQELDAEWRKEVRSWLVYHSPYFLNELASLARSAKDKDGWVSNEEALNALAKQDWETARPLLQSLAAGAQPRTVTVALAALYRHAIEAKESADEEKYRAQLRAIVSDRNAPGRARDMACNALAATGWPGQDEWYLSLFEDETLILVHDGDFGFTTIATLTRLKPDKWIPLVTKLIGNKNRTVHNAAVTCLAQFYNRDARKDALLPLLPWLLNSEWAEAQDRLRVIQSMDFIDIPESVPGLISVIANEDDSYYWGYAAESLAHYKDQRAVPALKAALAKEKDAYSINQIINSLVACGGLTDDEMAAALEAYAAKISTPPGRAEVEKFRNRDSEPLPLPISIGHFLSNSQTVPEEVALQVLERVKELQKTQPVVAKTLLEIVQKWKGRLVDLDLLRRVASNRADAETIASALTRREALRESVRPELYALLGQRGTAQGVGAALLADEAVALVILGGKDAQAQAALLASARLTNQPLPVETVSALLPSADKTLSLAAERYLLQEDSPAAQQILWTHHKDQAFITGWRENIPQIGGSNFDQMGREEEKLRAELLAENGPQEIYAALANGNNGHHIVRVYANRATYTFYENESRYGEVELKKETASEFRHNIAVSEIVEKGPVISSCHYDCIVTEFISLTRAQGRRVFSHSGFGGFGVWVLFRFEYLRADGPVKFHYRLADEIKGLEILFDGQKGEAKAIWQQGAEVRVLLHQKETASDEAKPVTDTDEDDDRETRDAKRKAEIQRRAAQERARYSWRILTNSKSGPAVAAPPVYFPDLEQEFEVDGEEFHTDDLALARAGDFVILSTEYNGPEGLWKKSRRQKAVPITSEGKYADVITTPDGQWAVAAKAEDGWGAPNQVVRVNLRTGREFQVKVPPAQNFWPVAYVFAHGKVLLYRARDDNSDAPKDGPDTPEYYLLDAATGKTELVKGEFAPLRQIDKRPLQPTGKPDEYWAALPDRENNKTQIGRYNTRSFAFQPVMSLPHIAFGSMDLWVDEAGGKIYVVDESQLLRLPLISK